MIPLIWTIGFFILFLLLLSNYLNGNKDYWRKQGVDHLDSGWGLLKKLWNSTDLLKINLVLYEKLGNKPFGGTVDFRTPGIMVRDPELLKKIMVKDFDYFVDRRSFGNDPVFARMLIGQEGDEWKHMRTILSPTFTTGKIRRMFDQVFLECSNEFISYTRKELKKCPDGELNLENILEKYTLGVISSSAFGIEMDTFKEKSEFSDKVRQMLEIPKSSMIKFGIIVLLPKIAEMLNLRLVSGEHLTFLQGLVNKNIQLREKSNEKRDDFFQLLLEAKWGSLKKEEEELNDFEKDAILKDSERVAKKGRKMDNDDIFAQAFLFLIGGFQTVTASLSFLIYNLTIRPELQEKIYNEVKEVMAQYGGKLTYDGINKLDLLDRVLAESLRLFPPGFGLERKCIQDYKIPGSDAVIKAGMIVNIPVYAMQRDPEYFPNPELFDPDRFTPENKDNINTYTYQPFGNGPRNCIGMRFAQTEIKILAANLILHMKLEPSPKTQIPCKLKIIGGTLKMAEGLVCKVIPRV